jgi:hypothetical protein
MLASACRSGEGEMEAGDAEASLPDTSMTEHMTRPMPDSLGLELRLPARVRVGETVTIAFFAQNQTQRVLDLYLRGRSPTFDVVIARPTGEVLWQRLEDEIIPAIVNLRTLAPDERLELRVIWEPRNRDGELLEAGAYSARGLLLTEGEPLETPPVSFRIE